jgi:hypothetical protein
MGRQAVPTTRAAFKTYCLRRLGQGVINVNVSNEQVEDRIDDALAFWWDYHFEGTEKTYYKYQITQTDIDNKYITIPDNIIGAVQIFQVGDLFNVDNMFNIRYQISLNDLYTLTAQSVIPYYMTMQHLELLQMLFVGEMPIRYNRHNNQVHIDDDWKRFSVGNWLVVEAYQVIDPDTYAEAWGDRWLQRYATALIKRQWGENMKKFQGMPMPGGMVMNGQQIYNEAVMEIKEIEDEIVHSYSLPCMDMIGPS